MPKIYQREQARRDIVEYFVYLADNAGIVVAERFLVNAEASFNELAQNPLIGSKLMLRNKKLVGMRKWRINDFDKILIFICHVMMVYLLYEFFMQRRIGGGC